jgi:hypothetical protein
MSPDNSKSKSSWVAILGLFGAITAPIWGAFINALLEQNGVFNDPNSILLSGLSASLSFVSSPIFIYAALFTAGILTGYLVQKWRHTRENEDANTSTDQEKRQALLAILNSVYRILSESEPGPLDREDEEIIQSLFRAQRSKLDSLNVTLKKCGFDPIDFQNFNVHERELLEFIHKEVSALLDDGHAEEAHERASTLLNDANRILDQTDESRPVRWIIDKDGDLYCPNHDYLISHDRIRETRGSGDNQVYEWPVHLSEKIWFELGPFLDVFCRALKSSPGGIDDEMYTRTRDEAVRTFHQSR